MAFDVQGAACERAKPSPYTAAPTAPQSLTLAGPRNWCEMTHVQVESLRRRVSWLMPSMREEAALDWQLKPFYMRR
jgi:hypothetical protein